MSEERILDKLDEIDGKVDELKVVVGRLDERSKGQEARITTLEKHRWAAVIGLITGLTSILAAGATAFVNFFLPRG